MRKLTADIIFPITSAPVKDAVLLISDENKIISIEPRSNFLDSELEIFKGALIPGFINTHCHLELSHLRNQFAQKTGLPVFLENVTHKRESTDEEIFSAIIIAEDEMIKNGIVAVADICNTSHTFQQKAKRNLHYHTFIELIGFNPQSASAVMDKGNRLLAEAHSFGLHASFAPHAPYSVSERLIERISNHNFENNSPTSFHMLESNDENELYVQGTGLYRKLYRDLKIDISFFKPSGKTSLETLLPYFNPEVNTLMVHNTIATPWDLLYAEELHPNLFWCLCPNANMFIEDRLPDILTLRNQAQYFTIGTDSLASNLSLDILSELQLLQKHFPSLQTNELLRWATLYGAKFLNIDNEFGSFDTGKNPGVVLLKNFNTDTMLLEGSSVHLTVDN